MRGLNVMETLLTRRNLGDSNIRKNLGAWSWALLARCREVGEMGSEDVAVLRILGKRAVWLARGLSVGRREEEEDEEDEDEEEKKKAGGGAWRG